MQIPAAAASLCRKMHNEENCYEKGDRKGKVEVKGRGMGICEMKILEEETVPVETPFHLFWRG